PLQAHLAQIGRLQTTSFRVQMALMEDLYGEGAVKTTRLTVLRTEIARSLEPQGPLAAETQERLNRAREALQDPDGEAPALDSTLAEFRLVLDSELRAHEAQLQALRRASHVEFGVAAAAAVALPLCALVAFWVLRNRVAVPLRDLGAFMSQLAREDYSEVPVRDADPLLAPLLGHYNHLVGRLRELERRHRDRQQGLENEVRMASRVLLEQQRDLDNAQRLAAVGELAAGLAHELRNPLAGVRMALSNLRRSLDDPRQVQRLDAVIDELRRIVRLLNDFLNRARQSPEPETQVDLAAAVTSLLDLARYQIPAAVRLHSDIAAGLTWRLPEGRLRQVLLNLVLNAAQAIGDRPGNITVAGGVNDNGLRIQVRDDGPGFPPPLLVSGPRAFVSGREGGTGLGLIMVRRFVEDLGGRLHLANDQPHGARVTLEIPAGDEHVG
ncbi:MAG: HAMP domain-containing histidine kinase, partial [Pseudomonadota bacterium]|nr:HAMP domain-containing histidine kinase [Pseudomonadota bacterium]